MSRRQIIKDSSQLRAATSTLNDAVCANFTPLLGGRKTAFPDLLAGALASILALSRALASILALSRALALASASMQKKTHERRACRPP
jgi:hypothetical protein